MSYDTEECFSYNVGYRRAIILSSRENGGAFGKGSLSSTGTVQEEEDPAERERELGGGNWKKGPFENRESTRGKKRIRATGLM